MTNLLAAGRMRQPHGIGKKKDVGDSTEIVIKTPMKQDFIDQRFESNRMLSAAKYSITVLMFNHVLSGIESVWSNQKKANAIKNQQSSKLQTDFGLVYDPSAKLELVASNYRFISNEKSKSFYFINMPSINSILFRN